MVTIYVGEKISVEQLDQIFDRFNNSKMVVQWLPMASIPLPEQSICDKAAAPSATNNPNHHE